MRQRKLVIGGLVGALLVAGAGFAGGYVLGAKSPEGLPVPGVANATVPSDIDAGDFGLFWKAWRLIDASYYAADDVSSEDRVNGAVKGLLGSLDDPYSEFFTPEESQRFLEAVQGSFGGVGIEIGIRQERLVVIAPLKDTPAARAGIRAGDSILEISGTSTESMSVSEAVAQIRGPEGSAVTLTLLGEGSERSREVKLVREKIEIPALKVTMEGDIAHVELYEFTADAGARFAEAMRGLPSSTKGVVLDVRNNPGGFLEVAVDIAGWFVPNGATVVQEAERDGQTSSFKAKGPATLENLPVVVLVNRGSASAAEILAGALRDLRKAPLVGETTFGKGVVQEVRDIPGGNGASVKLTVAEWLTPDGDRINKTGLKPDVEVATGTSTAASAPDLQLRKALEVVRQQFSR